MAASRRQDPDTNDLTVGLVGTPSPGRAELREREGRPYLVLRNEFATVWLAVETDASGVRVVITDAESGTTIALDPLELEAISRLRHADFDSLILERGYRSEVPESRTSRVAPRREPDPAVARDHGPASGRTP